MNRARGERLESIIKSGRKRQLRGFGCYAVKMTDTTPAPVTRLILRALLYDVSPIVLLRAFAITRFMVF